MGWIYTQELKDEMRGLKLSKGALEKSLKTAEGVIDKLREDNEKLRVIEKDIREEFQRKEEHAVALLKVEQQKTINEEVQTVKDEFSKKEKQLLEDNFNKLGTSLEELHNKGNSNTKFIEATSLKMMDVVAQLSGKKIDASNLSSVANAVLPAPVAEIEYLVDPDTGKEYYIEDGEEFWKE